jgi:hypothetical protein
MRCIHAKSPEPQALSCQGPALVLAELYWRATRARVSIVPRLVLDWCSIGARLVLDWCSIGARLFFDCSSIVLRLFFDCCWVSERILPLSRP